jgi:YD repeat-containing protein
VLASFSYDELGRRTGIARGNGTVTSYGYDAASRLASLTQELAGTDNDAAATFRHNPAMQIASETRSNPRYQWSGGGNGTVTSTPNALNQIAAHNGVAFSYDAKATSPPTARRNFAYTAENRLASGPGTNLYYDPLGRLVHRSGPQTNFHYDGQDIIQETAPGGALRRFVHGPGTDEPLVQYDGAGTATNAGSTPTSAARSSRSATSPATRRRSTATTNTASRRRAMPACSSIPARSGCPSWGSTRTRRGCTTPSSGGSCRWIRSGTAMA